MRVGAPTGSMLRGVRRPAAAARPRGRGGRRPLATVPVAMRGAPIRGPALTEGAGVVAEAAGAFSRGDLVFAAGVRGAWGDAEPVACDENRTVKLPAATPLADRPADGSAMRASRCTGTARNARKFLFYLGFFFSSFVFFIILRSVCCVVIIINNSPS